MDDAPLSNASGSERQPTDSPNGSAPPSDATAASSDPARKQRLGRGLSQMLRQPKNSEPAVEIDEAGDSPSDPTAATVTLVREEATPPAVVPPNAVASADSNDDVNAESHTETPNGGHQSQTSMNASTSANVVEDAVSLFTSYDERFNTLTGQLEATCSLLEAQRKLELRRAVRSSRVAWSVVAALVVLGMIGLWRAGETIGDQQADIRHAMTQASILGGNLEAAEKQITTLQSDQQIAATNASQMQSELDDLRSALAQANLVIDQWMKRAHDKEAEKKTAKAD